MSKKIETIQIESQVLGFMVGQACNSTAFGITIVISFPLPPITAHKSRIVNLV
jgi:hypothetical protein